VFLDGLPSRVNETPREVLEQFLLEKLHEAEQRGRDETLRELRFPEVPDCEKCRKWREMTEYVYCPDHDVFDTRPDDAKPEDYRRNPQKP